jgi:hypothetical protein
MAEADGGCYVYCVVPAHERPPLEGLRGVDPASRIELVGNDRLSAVMSRVSLEEFGEEALRRNFEDMAWLERTARAHQAVLDRALEGAAAIVPMRLCTIFEDEEHVGGMLERQRDVLVDALERVRDRREWSVKVLADPRAVEAGVRARDSTESAEPGTAGAGHAYVARKRLERSLRERSRELLEAAAEEVHERLGKEAEAATLLPPQRRELSGRSGDMILNAAYLVQLSRVDAFATAVEGLREGHRDLGLELVLTGPWAPYNFVDAKQAA